MTRFEKNPKTEADVRVLLTHYRDLQPDGTLVLHSEIEGLLRLRRAESRYKTVVKHFRKALYHERNIFLDGRSAEGHGYRALTGDDRVRWTNRRVREYGRGIARAIAVVATTPDDQITDPRTRLYRAHLLSGAEQIKATHTRILREIGTALAPPKQLPQAPAG